MARFLLKTIVRTSAGSVNEIRFNSLEYEDTSQARADLLRLNTHERTRRGDLRNYEYQMWHIGEQVTSEVAAPLQSVATTAERSRPTFEELVANPALRAIMDWYRPDSIAP